MSPVSGGIGQGLVWGSLVARAGNPIIPSTRSGVVVGAATAVLAAETGALFGAAAFVGFLAASLAGLLINGAARWLLYRRGRAG